MNSTVNYSGNETLCAYCGSGNHQEDHRCVRCGRRLPAPAPLSAGPVATREMRSTGSVSAEMRGAGLMAAEMMVERTLGVRRTEPAEPRAESRRPSQTPQYEAGLYEASLARQPRLVESPSSRQAAPEESKPAQGVLFTAHEVRRGEPFRTKVVSLEDYREPAARAKRRPAPRTRPAGRTLPPSDAEAQGNLFSELTDEPIIVAAAPLPDAGLRCDAMVAPWLQRAVATMLDGAMICLAEGLLLFALLLSPAADFISANTLPGLAVFGAFLTFGYKMIFALAETDSPGTRWTHLRVLNFDGVTPTRGERLARLAGGVLSIAAAGLGLIWALVDEETLSWHDHISKTFASPADQ